MRDVLRYRLLGPFAVERDGAVLDVGTPKQRALLAVLVQAAGRPVSADRLVDSVWGDDHPASVQSSLHANISRLRGVLRETPSSPPPIVRGAGGYLLDVSRAEVDVDLFRSGAAAASAAVERGDWTRAVETAGQALAWWRGVYLDDMRDEEWVRLASAPLNERRIGAVHDLVVGLLGAGDTTAALATSTALLSEQPLVERTAWLHMTALHQAGRTPEALDTFRTFTQRLDDELGLDPGPALRELHGALLRQDPEPGRWPGRAAVGASTVSAAAAPVRAVHVPSAPLVGRLAELAAIDAVLETARAGSTRWVVLSGPAGMGKTRLAEEAMNHWTESGGTIARGQCPDLDDVPAWWPIRQVLRALNADPDAILAPAAGDDLDAVRFIAQQRAADVVQARASQRPLMVVVDDVHWADRESLGLLTMLAETVNAVGLVIVLTTRPTRGRLGLDRLLAAVARRPGNRHVVLDALGAADVARLVEQVSGVRPDAEDATALAIRTGGTPFYVVEYARLPAEQRRGGAIPAAVRTVLRQRLAELPPQILETAQVAAVLGDPLDVRLLAAVLRHDERELADRLDDAADLELLVPSLEGATYDFAHALLRDELAAAIPDLRRQRLHLRAAEWLADRSALPDLLRRARHLQAAGPAADPVQAYPAFRAAAAAADERWFYGTAAIWWQAAVAAHDRLPDGDADEHDSVIAAQVRAMAWAGQSQAVLDALDAALVDALRAGRTASVGRLAANLLRVSGAWPWPVYGSDVAPLMQTLSGLDTALRRDPGAHARVLAVTAIGYCYHPDPTVPDDMSRRAIELAEQSGDDGVLADALLGRALTYAGVAARAEESIDLLDRLSTLQHDHAAADDVLGRNIRTMALLSLGRVAECAENVRAAAVGADVLRMPINRVQLRWAEAALAQWQAGPERAGELYRRAELAHRRTDLQQSGTFELAELVLLWDRGRPAESTGTIASNPMVSQWTSVAIAAFAGRPGCDDALRAEVRRPEPEVWTSHGRWTLLAHCVADRELRDLAPELLAALTPVQHCLASFGQIGAIGPVALAMARLARLLGDDGAARAHLTAATAMAQRTGGSTALLHCRLVEAGWAAADAGPTSELRQELLAIALAAEELGLDGIADRARRLL